MKKFFLIFGLMIFTFISCSQEDTSVLLKDTIKDQNTNIIVNEGEIKYSDEKISFVYPNDWLITNEQDPVNQSEVLVVTNTNSQGALENFTFVVHNFVNSGTDFDTFVNDNVENIESQIALMNGHKLSQNIAKVNGKDATTIKYEYELDGEMVHSFQYYMNYNGKGYIITTTTSSNEEESSNEVFERLLESFVIEK